MYYGVFYRMIHASWPRRGNTLPLFEELEWYVKSGKRENWQQCCFAPKGVVLHRDIHVFVKSRALHSVEAPHHFEKHLNPYRVNYEHQSHH